MDSQVVPALAAPSALVLVLRGLVSPLENVCFAQQETCVGRVPCEVVPLRQFQGPPHDVVRVEGKVVAARVSRLDVNDGLGRHYRVVNEREAKAVSGSLRL